MVQYILNQRNAGEIGRKKNKNDCQKSWFTMGMCSLCFFYHVFFLHLFQYFSDRLTYFQSITLFVYTFLLCTNTVISCLNPALAFIRCHRAFNFSYTSYVKPLQPFILIINKVADTEYSENMTQKGLGYMYTTKGRDRFHWAATPLKPYKVGNICSMT